MNSPLSRVRTPLSLWSLRNRLILATVVMASLAIIASDFAANAALRTYLISQVDKGLVNISNASLTRLEATGITPPEAALEDSPFKILPPLGGVPTTISITLLDRDGNLIGRIGGELAGENFSITGLKLADVEKYKYRPFTIDGKGNTPDVRALAQLLPTGLGSVIVANSLAEVDQTLSRLRFLFLTLGLIALLIITIEPYAPETLFVKPPSIEE